MIDHLVPWFVPAGRALGAGPLFAAWYDDLVVFSGFSAMMWTAIVAALATVWWFSAIYLRDGRTVKTYDSPPRLFRELCRAHKLAGREIDMLQQLADERGLDSPSLLFVREDYFAEQTTTEFETLRKKLFGAANANGENVAASAA